MWELYLIIAAIVIFSLYTGISIKMFGIPSSLSETFYLFNGKKKNLGYLFTGMMFIVPLLLIPAWLQITESITPWSHYLTVLPFIAGSSIAFVGAAPAFKTYESEGKVHTVSAILSAVFSLLWCAVICYKIAYIIPIAVLIIILLAYYTKSWSKSKTFWLEMMAFLSTFITLIIECLILLY